MFHTAAPPEDYRGGPRGGGRQGARQRDGGGRRQVQERSGPLFYLSSSAVDPNTLNLNPDAEIWSNLDPDSGLCYKF